MITRRELLRRAGLAGLVATPLVAAAKLAPKQPTELLLNDKPIKPVTSLKRPIRLDGSEISINGEIVGSVTNIEMTSQRAQVIDVTNLDSERRTYQPHVGPDYSELKITLLDNGESALIIHDALNGGKSVKIAMIMGGLEYEFKAYIMSHEITASINEAISHEIMIMVSGEILVT